MNEKYMQLAIKEAQLAAEEDEVPIGAVIVYNDKVIAMAHNQKEHRQNATAHAEMMAIEQAVKVLGTWHLDGCSLYVTLEPCMMCSGAIVLSRFDQVIIGATEKRWPAMLTLLEAHTFNHRPEIIHSAYEDVCSHMLSDYFRAKRKRD